ncbi:hypothetical protein [Psychrobacillus sp. MER TA 171]|uniref:hypothetical protein n=1 Tax=Psychrobacillus sp. MER TA 171 TaxID=2939577 RepID=UPI00203A5798|nr:hypothetical protein [Psychrobacillus sp. MER TA 171]MCM3356883.1 hypothetical protein [Psychrobacillus sp. MER TA 171]
MENARRQLYSHRSIFPFDPEGKAVELAIKKSATACLCPDRQMEKSEEAVLSHRSF